MKKQTPAFTLVELIVVIVILAILGTIAFISFQGYSRNSRDSVRIADINSVKKSLEIFITKAGFYPTPDNGVNITYSGAIVWTEGTLGENVIKNIESVSKVITDPLTSNEYTYSITSSKTEYQIGAISEGGGLTNNQTINKTYATDLSKTSAVAYISGNYNEKFTKVSTGTTSWILAQPSIIATDIGNPDLSNIITNKKVVFNNYGNYPHSYNQNSSGNFNYTNGNPIIFTGTLEELHEDNQRKLDFLTNLKQAYASTDLATNPMYQDIMNIDTTNDSTGAINLVISYINSNKGGIKLEQLALIGNTSSTTGGESGGGETNDYAICTGQNTPTPFSATTTYGGCDTADIIVCSGAGTGYTISACNVGASIAGTDWMSNLTVGQHFQWGRNDGFNNNSGAVSITTSSIYSGTIHIEGGIDLRGNITYSGVFIIGSSTYAYNWLSKIGETTDPNWGQGPCSAGYHVPSKTEWTGLIIAGGWGTNGANMQTLLKLPYAGSRSYGNGGLYNQGSYGVYWSSSPNGNLGYYLYFTSNLINYGDVSSRSNGLTIRCFKN